jgi:hypothetical protein
MRLQGAEASGGHTFGVHAMAAGKPTLPASCSAPAARSAFDAMSFIGTTDPRRTDLCLPKLFPIWMFSIP